MSRRIRFATGEYYHLYNRGTEKRNIFSSKDDYERFLALLYLCNDAGVADLKSQGRTLNEIVSYGTVRQEPRVDLCLYCLMPNHFHVLVRAKDDKGVSQFMQKLLTGYTMYFNKRRERTGALFKGNSRHNTQTLIDT